MVTNNIKFVAELTINHLGMVSIAKQMIKSAKEAGATLIKLKLKNVEKYYEDDSKKWRNFNFNDYRGSLELSKEDFFELDKYCKSLDIEWFCTVHDKEGLDFLKQFNLPLYKVASMDADKSEFVDYVIELCKKEGKPLVISVGGKDIEFTDELVGRINDAKIKAFLLHTVSIYPTPTGKNNINFIPVLKDKYESENVRIGYSGHEVGYSATLLAAMNGVAMIERHFTLSKDWAIHHLAAALTPSEYQAMTSLITNIKLENINVSSSYDEEELRFLKGMDYQ
ncbi:N-acetylneuraminate synthase family protein [Vibrio sp. ZSDE26]|uniref:N-acetylneuraminate synthase family protein n=1 Tax=Vibrio amylolyticus TaxID=2847292 RepID=A0A9X1XHG1_9VIBR|nr:N-acetylneuraminate synthase family protein [Vibrio amylolyticus]MCK6263247.1 N-acetylneuraminate synthase family protein [Vibrio amylolyticus]